ncbi:MAG TPA: GNAT family N-acetyltransferase, partial [Chitinophagaceae bacterium]|nr:GNAT family N-acetyltransferase [Chitinophagaceae bacterium]
MNNELKIVRTGSDDPAFRLLISHLDNELWNELREDQATYDQFNQVPGIQTAIVVNVNGKPAAIGCFKVHDTSTIEIKRMFVEKEFRGKGLSKL